MVSHQNGFLLVAAVIYLLAFTYNLNHYQPLSVAGRGKEGNMMGSRYQLVQGNVELAGSTSELEEYDYGQEVYDECERRQRDFHRFFIEIEEQLKYQSNEPLRILQGYATGLTLMDYLMVSFQTLFSTFRNLILIALFTNMMEPILPFIILCDSFLMLAFLDTQMFTVGTFYANIFNSKMDLMNAIRLGVSGEGEGALPQLKRYGFTGNVFVNLSGEMVVLLGLLLVTVGVKLGSIWCNSEKFRKVKSILRPTWNGLVMALLPRLATFAGFSLSYMQTVQPVINGMVSSTILVLFVLFFILLLYQIRKVVKKQNYIQSSIPSIGLSSRLNYQEQFQFDCLSFSMIYHPLINYVRLLVFYLCLGAGRSVYYISFGGPICSQIFMMMADISSPYFIKHRDRFFVPLNNFLMVLLEICLVSIGLAEGVGHSEVSDLFMTVLFIIGSFLFLGGLGCMVLDVRDSVKRRCRGGEEDEEGLDEGRSQDIRRSTRTRSIDRKIKKTELSNEIKNTDDLGEQTGSELTRNDSNKVYHLKIRKLKRIK